MRTILAQEEESRIAAAAALPEMRARLDTLRQGGFNPVRFQSSIEALDRRLLDDGVPATDLWRVRNRINRHPPSAITNAHPVAVRPKTDPVMDSLQVIKRVPESGR